MIYTLINVLIVFLITFFGAYGASTYIDLREAKKSGSQIKFKEYMRAYWRIIPIPGIHFTPKIHFASWVFDSVEFTDKGFAHNCSECHRKRYLTELEEKNVNF